MNLKKLFSPDLARQKALAESQIVTDSSRCVQCGICSYNCPIGIDVRRHAWQNQPVIDNHCLSCGECVRRCPRGVLRFEAIPLFELNREEGKEKP